jgi:hypothetical protein
LIFPELSEGLFPIRFIPLVLSKWMKHLIIHYSLGYPKIYKFRRIVWAGNGKKNPQPNQDWFGPKMFHCSRVKLIVGSGN